MASPGSSSRHMPKFNVSPSASPREEHYYLSKKPRNYKYWSDEEIKKILSWLTLPENEGKLTRNKAQACREVAKTLFDGDEYMAISVRSKLMSLEKLYKEAEQIKALPANTYNNTKEELLNQDKIKEISKFYKECKQLFSKSDASLNHNSSPTPTPASPINKHLLRPEYDLPPIHDHELHHKSWNPTLPRMLDLPPIEEQENYKKKKYKVDLKIAKYAAKQASFEAKKAEYEALKSEYDMKLAEIQLDRDALHVKKLELELHLQKQT